MNYSTDFKSVRGAVSAEEVLEDAKRLDDFML